MLLPVPMEPFRAEWWSDQGLGPSEKLLNLQTKSLSKELTLILTEKTCSTHIIGSRHMAPPLHGVSRPPKIFD